MKLSGREQAVQLWRTEQAAAALFHAFPVTLGSRCLGGQCSGQGSHDSYMWVMADRSIIVGDPLRWESGHWHANMTIGCCAALLCLCCAVLCCSKAFRKTCWTPTPC
jgi:hypothetical protein